MIDAREAEEAIYKETTHAVEYAAQYHQAKIELSRLIEKEDSRNTSTPIPPQQSLHAVIPTQESIRALKLPKIELRKFAGDIRDWLPF